MNDTPRDINVPNPSALFSQLETTFSGIHGLIHVLREQTIASTSESGCKVFDDEAGPCSFQVTSQYERPEEFLQTLLDLVRIIFEPNPPGTTLLNSNVGYLLDEIGQRPFRLGYMSAISQPGECFADFDQREIAPRLHALGYSRIKPNAAFWMLTYGTHNAEQRRAIRIAIMNQYSAGFTVEQFVPKSAAVVQGIANDSPESGQVYAGFSSDAALGPDRFRLSAWLFLPPSWVQ